MLKEITSTNLPSNHNQALPPNTSKLHMDLHAKVDCQMAEPSKHLASSKSNLDILYSHTPSYESIEQTTNFVEIIKPTHPNTTTNILSQFQK